MTEIEKPKLTKKDLDMMLNFETTKEMFSKQSKYHQPEAFYIMNNANRQNKKHMEKYLHIWKTFDENHSKIRLVTLRDRLKEKLKKKKEMNYLKNNN
jgi:hypothetical protein